MRRPTRILLLRAIAVALSAGSNVHAAGLTLCSLQETVVFSCAFRNAKIVSICSASGKNEDHVAYRFGKPGNIELSYLADAAHPGHIFHRAEVVAANNADDLIWFTNRRHLYRVYMPMRGLPGLEIFRNGKTVARMECKGDWTETSKAETPPSKFILDHGSGRASDFEQFETAR